MGFRPSGGAFLSLEAAMITAILSRKGGVGKTTTAVNLATALAGLGRRTLLVDLDAQASASRSLGVARGDLAPSAADVLLSGLPAADAVRRTTVPGLDLVTASVDLARVDADLGVLRRRESRLQASLAPLRGAYEFILLDCPSALSLVPTNAGRAPAAEASVSSTAQIAIQPPTRAAFAAPGRRTLAVALGAD